MSLPQNWVVHLPEPELDLLQFLMDEWKVDGITAIRAAISTAACVVAESRLEGQ